MERNWKGNSTTGWSTKGNRGVEGFIIPMPTFSSQDKYSWVIRKTYAPFTLPEVLKSGGADSPEAAMDAVEFYFPSGYGGV